MPGGETLERVGTNIQNTTTPELRFRAILSENTSDVCFERT